MAKKTATLDWCIVRLGEDHNWWVDEISDDVHWDTDHLSIIDPRQIDYVLELTEPLKEYGFDPDVMDRALIPFRIEKDAGNGRIRLVRVSGSLLESDDKLFGLPDVVDEENGPYADFLDHVTRCRVKMLNDTMDFDEKLTVDEVEEEIREEQNNLFMEGRSVHLFTELTAILDYVPAGWDDEEDSDKKKRDEADEADDADFEIDVEEEEKLKNDSSLRWDEEEGEEDDEEKDEEDVDDDEDSPRSKMPDEFKDEEISDDDEEEEDEEEDEKPRKKVAKSESKPAKVAKTPKAPAKPAAKAPAAKAPPAKKGRKS